MGARAKARRAADAAQKQYYEALSKIEALPEIRRAESDNVKKLEENLGENVSYGTKRLAQQADRLGKEINNDEKYGQYVGRYNQRYAALKEQLAGRTTQSYYVNDPKGRGKGGGGGGQAQSTPVIGHQSMGGFVKESNTGMAGMAVVPNAVYTADPNTMTWKSMDQGGLDQLSAKNAERTYYSSQEDALAEATKRMEAYNAKQGLLGTNKKVRTIDDPNKLIGTQTYGAIGNGWRGFMGESAGAYTDMKVLADKIKGTGSNQFIQQYSDIANKLRTKVKREDGVINVNQTGLLNQDLAGADLNTGVIK